MAQRCPVSWAYAVIPAERKRETHTEEEKENHLVAGSTKAAICEKNP